MHKVTKLKSIEESIQNVNKNAYSFYNLRQRMYTIKNELIKESQSESK